MGKTQNLYVLAYYTESTYVTFSLLSLTKCTDSSTNGTVKRANTKNDYTHSSI